MAGESIEELLKSTESEIQSSKEYISEENKAYRDQRAKEGVKTQQAPPEQERKRSEKPQPQTRQRVQKPER